MLGTLETDPVTSLKGVHNVIRERIYLISTHVGLVNRGYGYKGM